MSVTQKDFLESGGCVVAFRTDQVARIPSPLPLPSWPSVPGKERLHILTLEPTQPRRFPVLSPAPFRVTPSEAWWTVTCKAFAYVAGRCPDLFPTDTLSRLDPRQGQA